MEEKILLIEDDPLSARLADLILSSEGYRVVVAPSGHEGLRVARDMIPDLILLDLMLPGVDGFRVLGQLRADPRTADVRVIVVSSKAQATDKHTATRMGADEYLTKPYRKAELLDIVRAVLRKKLEEKMARGCCVLLVAPHDREARRVAVNTGTALAGQGEPTVVVDLHPFSVEHCALLDLPPRPTPVSLSGPEMEEDMSELMVEHASGLQLLNNLQGGGEAGQLVPEDASRVLDVLLTRGGFVLVDLPLYPTEILRHTADRCNMVFLVVPGDVAALAAARSVLALVKQFGVASAQTGVVLVGAPEEEELGGLGDVETVTVPAEADRDDSAFQALADRLRSLRHSSP